MLSSMVSMSASVTSAVGRSICIDSTGFTETSGITSMTAANFRSLPGSIWMGSMRGLLAGRRFSLFTASL